MSKTRKHRPRKPPKGNYHPTGKRQPLNLTGTVNVSDEIDRLRRQATNAGVPELLEPNETAYAAVPRGNVIAARDLVAAMKLGATPFVDPTSLFDLAHLAMAVHFDIDFEDDEYTPDDEQFDWLTSLTERCGLKVETICGGLIVGPSMSAFEQYQRVSVIGVKRIALIES